MRNNNMKKAFCLVIVILFCFISCDSFRYAQGIVVDKETREPLGNINIYNGSSSKDEYIFTQTDSIGYFEFSFITAWGVPRNFWIRPEGYKPINVKYNNDTLPMIIELEKIYK